MYIHGSAAYFAVDYEVLLFTATNVHRDHEYFKAVGTLYVRFILHDRILIMVCFDWQVVVSPNVESEVPETCYGRAEIFGFLSRFSVMGVVVPGSTFTV